jgi:hypothetical protein
MEDLTEVREEFQSVDGIEANPADTSHDGESVLVKVNDEAAVGRFYGTARELGVELSAVTRDGLPYTVLDAWARLSDEE